LICWTPGLHGGPGKCRYHSVIQSNRFSPWRAWAVLAAMVAIAAVLAWRPLSDAILRRRLTAAMNRARAAAGDPARFQLRLASTSGTAAFELADAAELVELGRDAGGDDESRATGLAHFVAGDCERSADAFGRVRNRTPSDWNDLAAAQICTATKANDPQRWIGALTANDRAFSADPGLAEARFNRARLLELAGLSTLAQQHWERYVAVDPGSGWAKFARDRIANRVVSESQRWRTAVPDPEKASPETLAPLVRSLPQDARLYCEGIFLSIWAEAVVKGERDRAARALANARAIADVLQRESGERLASDAIAAIDAARSSSRLRSLASGQLAYRAGRFALRQGDFATAELELARARDAFAHGGSPMARLADFYVADAVRNQNRTTEALRMQRRLRDLETGAGSSYPTLLARIHHELALCEALLGHWSDAVASASAAAATYTSMRERGNAAASEAVVSESFDFLGHPELAWKHGLAAVRDASAAGDLHRVRVTLGALTRTELRGRRWQQARALAHLDQELSAIYPGPQLDAGNLLRLAMAEWHLRNRPMAMRALDGARSAAHKVPAAGREKLMAEVDAATGVFMRRDNPQRGVQLLTASIAFQTRADRPIVLPELYLERGRAFLESNDVTAAERDFDAGIRELERQRMTVRDTFIRLGIFADASELFEEALALQLRRGSGPAAVLETIERGRARAVLEQMEMPASEARSGRLLIKDVQHRLSGRAALVEYEALRDQLVIICVTHRRVTMTRVPIPRAKLAALARRFTDDVIARKENAGAELYDVLVRPVAAELQNLGAITVVPDEILERVAIGALFDSRSQKTAIEQFVIATAPSAAVFARTADTLRMRPHRAPSSVLVFANPDVPRDEFPALVSLSASEWEAGWIARQYQKSHLLARSQATAERFLTLAPKSDIVHFGGHAVIRRNELAGSALICAASPGMRGVLTLREIAQMRFSNTQTVVLAACSTLDGRNAAIEGVPSLARGFLVAGVPSVIGTLWDIEDREAVAVMRVLHEHLARGAFPADALRTAQLTAIRNGRPPAEWAAFSVMGAAAPPPSPMLP
jgi:CHAT domain-containing protein